MKGCVFVKLIKKGKEKFNVIKKMLFSSLPVIFFFLVLFYAIIILFGFKQVMIVSLITVQFQINRKKRQTAKSLLKLAGLQFVLQLLAFMATLNLPLCLLLNLLVPFWLIFTKSSQFNQLGYFSSLMTFTFLQLMPAGFTGFFTQIKAMLFALIFFFVVTLMYTRKHQSDENDFSLEQQGIQLFTKALEQKANNQIINEELKELFKVQQTLYNKAYLKKEKKYIVSSEGKKHYLFALMFQRGLYFLSELDNDVINDLELKKFMIDIADYFKDININEFEDNIEKLKKQGSQLNKITENKKDWFYSSINSFLRIFLLILNQFQNKEDINNEYLDKNWRVPLKEKIKLYLRYYVKLDAFEFRFALRMSLVLMIGMAYNMVALAEHGYWLVMNAFLLLRPMYEDSMYRMKTRFIGTVAGCGLMAILLLYINQPYQHFILASVMVMGMYSAIPGTWIHGLFVTCFALSMTTLALGTTIALELRIFYVAVAIMMVLLINRFFFPTSLKTQYKYNLNLLFHMHHMYLRLLENALLKPLDYWKICEALIQYHMVHLQLKTYLDKISNGKDVEKILAISWQMVAKMEQMFFLVNTKRRGIQEKQKIIDYIVGSDYVLNHIQDMLNLKKEKIGKNIEETNYCRTLDNEIELSNLMYGYGKELSKLYLIVCQKYLSK